MTEQLWPNERIEAYTIQRFADATCRYAAGVAMLEMRKEFEAEIERLRSEIATLKAGVWTPINAAHVRCAQFEGCGANQHGDYLIVWNGEIEAAVWLPDDVRLCRKVTP